MRHFPIFLDLRGKVVVLSGGGAAALAKLRLLMRTEAELRVFAPQAAPEIESWAADGRLTLIRRPAGPEDIAGAALVYAADDAPADAARMAALGRAGGVPVNVVDDLEASQFITPAIVDRDPVTIAIGTEGTAPVLARALKAELEARLPSGLGRLARIASGFRLMAAKLPAGRPRRAFWQAFFERAGPQALAEGGEPAARARLGRLFDAQLRSDPPAGHVAFVGAGPGDPDLLTLRARHALDSADVVIHDRLVPRPILDLARREATVIEAGKTGFGPSTPQGDIDALIVAHARRGAQVVRLKGGDPTIFARLDEEIDACEAAGVGWSIVPGLTAASAAAAALGQSLSRRGRNSALRILTGHDVAGFADQDWAGLSRPGEVAAIYMGKAAARFVQGRLLMHGADRATPVSVVENAGRPEQRVLATSLGRLPAELSAAGLNGPALILLGLAPRAAAAAAPDIAKELA